MAASKTKTYHTLPPFHLHNGKLPRYSYEYQRKSYHVAPRLILPVMTAASNLPIISTAAIYDPSHSLKHVSFLGHMSISCPDN